MVFSFRFWWLCNFKHTEGVPMAQLFATEIYTTIWTLPGRSTAAVEAVRKGISVPEWTVSGEDFPMQAGMRRPCPFSIMARYCQYERALPREKPPYRSRHGTPSVYPYFQCGRFSPVITAAARTGMRSGGFSSQSRKDKKRRRQRLSGAAFFASVDRGAGAFFPA